MQYSFWQIVAWMFWFMLLVAWIWLMIAIISDIFRDDEMGGGAKALWCIFVVLLPWLGVLVYLIARGSSMRDRAMREQARNEQQFRSYVREVSASGTGVSDELAKLAQMRDAGTISPQDYELAKQTGLGGATSTPV